MLAVYAVHSASTPLTIRTAHRVPRGREQERTHLAEQREQAQAYARAHTSKSARKQERTRHKRERRAESKRESEREQEPTPAPLSRESVRLLAPPRVRGGKEGF